MGPVVASCYNCRRPLRAIDFERGRAIQVGSLAACEACAEPLLARLTPEQQRAIFEKLERGDAPPDEGPEIQPADAPLPERSSSHRARAASPRVSSPSLHGRTAPAPAPAPPRPILLYVSLAAAGAIGLLLLLLLGGGGAAPPAPAPAKTRDEAASKGRIEPSVDAARLEPARAALQKAREAERDRPDDFDATARLYDEAFRAAESTALAAEARREREAAAARYRASLDGDLAALEQDVRAKRDAKEFRAALDRVEAARPRRAAPEWTRTVDRVAQETLEAAEAAFGALKTKAMEAQRRGDRDEVARSREEAARWGVPKYVEQLEKALTEESSRQAGDGLAGWWKMDDAEGVYAADALARFNGMVGGRAAWQSAGGKTGGAIRMDGQDDDVRVRREPPLEPEAVTCMAWIRMDETPGKWANVIRKTWKNNSGPSAASYALQLNPNGNAPTSLAFITGFSGGHDNLTSPSDLIATGGWLHLAGAYDPRGPSPQKRLFVNGKRVADKSLTRPLVYDTTITGDLYFGQNGRGDERFKGLLDDVRIYARALSDKEVQSIYEGRTP